MISKEMTVVVEMEMRIIEIVMEEMAMIVIIEKVETTETMMEMMEEIMMEIMAEIIMEIMTVIMMGKMIIIVMMNYHLLKMRKEMQVLGGTFHHH